MLMISALLLGVMATNPPPGPQGPEAMLERVLQSVVEIRAKNGDGISSGSGVILTPEGAIATNLHIVRGANTIAVRLQSGEIFEQVTILGYDNSRDLALLKIAGFGLPVLPLANSDDVRAGATVFAVGHPLGLEDTITRGIISGVRVLEGGVKVLQTDAAASPGNSGGPLVSETGEVVGIVTFKLQGENLNFAIPVNYVRGLASSPRNLTLAEFTSELGARGESLFDESDVGVTGRWRSLTTNTVKILRQDGEYINGEMLGPNGESIGTYDLKRQPDGSYKGKVRGRFDCSYYTLKAFPAAWFENHCVDESEIEFTKIGANRIEGRGLGRKPPPGPNKTRAWADYCRSCGNSIPPTWEPFAWVRIP